MLNKKLDLIAIGRSCVDLYGQQVGGRLEDMSSFAKYVGGSPTNTAIGCSRLGLESGLVTAVGNEHMGRFIIESLKSEGVDVDGVKTDDDRLTALVLLGIRDKESFPLIFYRENCADMALTVEDLDEDYIASAKAILVSGTHFSTPTTGALSHKAAEICRANGGKVAFDIDYRPVLWGVSSHDTGEERYIKSDEVTEHLQPILPICDLIVGTEEELHIAGGTTDTLEAIKHVRSKSDATIVCKRGALGCVIFPGDIPDDIEDGIKGPGYPIEVYNVLGAGDAFMSGFLRGWIREEPLEKCAQFANACGAFAVSRHGCSPAIPSWEELQYFINNGSSQKALRLDQKLNQLHWSTTRKKKYDSLVAFAIDHRAQFEEIAQEVGADVDRVGEFKLLALKAIKEVSGGKDGYGTLLDDIYGEDALHAAMEENLWVGRPIELPGSRPLKLEVGDNIEAALREWPVDQCVKCLVFYHPSDLIDLKIAQEKKVVELYDACRSTGHEFLLEIVASKHGDVTKDTVSQAINRFYELGVYPDWWKLEPTTDPEAWEEICKAIESNDPYCHGIVILGLSASDEELNNSFKIASQYDLVKGFAVGRTIFADAAKAWLAGNIDDAEALRNMAGKFQSLVDMWLNLKAK